MKKKYLSQGQVVWKIWLSRPIFSCPNKLREKLPVMNYSDEIIIMCHRSNKKHHELCMLADSQGTHPHTYMVS